MTIYCLNCGKIEEEIEKNEKFIKYGFCNKCREEKILKEIMELENKLNYEEFKNKVEDILRFYAYRVIEKKEYNNVAIFLLKDYNKNKKVLIIECEFSNGLISINDILFW